VVGGPRSTLPEGGESREVQGFFCPLYGRGTIAATAMRGRKELVAGVRPVRARRSHRRTPF